MVRKLLSQENYSNRKTTLTGNLVLQEWKTWNMCLDRYGKCYQCSCVVSCKCIFCLLLAIFLPGVQQICPRVSRKIQTVGELGSPFWRIRTSQLVNWNYLIGQWEPPYQRNETNACSNLLMSGDKVVSIVQQGGSNCPTR